VHVHADTRPGPEFEPVEADLEDVYFSVMAGHQGVRAGVVRTPDALETVA
jgi:hypothetical protein